MPPRTSPVAPFRLTAEPPTSSQSLLTKPRAPRFAGVLCEPHLAIHKPYTSDLNVSIQISNVCPCILEVPVGRSFVQKPFLLSLLRQEHLDRLDLSVLAASAAHLAVLEPTGPAEAAQVRRVIDVK